MKNSNHSIALTLDVSPEEAWKIIGAVKGVDQWLAPITACRVEGDKRYCTTEGGEFSEDILKVDHNNKIFQYGIPSQNMIPVQNILGEMKVLDADGGRATVEWSWAFEVAEENETQAKETLSMVGNMGLKGIESLIKEVQV